MLNKKFFTGLCLIVSTNAFCQNYDNHFKNYAKSTGKEIREFRAVKDMAFSDDNIYAINGRATYVPGASIFSESSHQEPMFYCSKTAQNFAFNHIGTNNPPVAALSTDNLAVSKKAKYSTIEANTYVDASNNANEILFVGTSNNEVRKYDGTAWLGSSLSEINLPFVFSSNVMAKYQEGPETYCLLGLSGVEQENIGGFLVNKPTLYRAVMNDLNTTVWQPRTITATALENYWFRLPVVDVIVSEKNTSINYVAVNDGKGELSTIGDYYPAGLPGIPSNIKVNGIWWTNDGAIYRRLDFTEDLNGSLIERKEQFYITKLKGFNPEVNTSFGFTNWIDRALVTAVYNVPKDTPTFSNPTDPRKPYLTSTGIGSSFAPSGCGVLALGMNENLSSPGQDLRCQKYDLSYIPGASAIVQETELANFLTDIDFVYDYGTINSEQALKICVGDYGNGLYNLIHTYSGLAMEPPQGLGWDTGNPLNSKCKEHQRDIFKNPEFGLFALKSDFDANNNQTVIYSGGYASFNKINLPSYSQND